MTIKYWHKYDSINTYKRETVQYRYYNELIYYNIGIFEIKTHN